MLTFANPRVGVWAWKRISYHYRLMVVALVALFLSQVSFGKKRGEICGQKMLHSFTQTTFLFLFWMSMRNVFFYLSKNERNLPRVSKVQVRDDKPRLGSHEITIALFCLLCHGFVPTSWCQLLFSRKLDGKTHLQSAALSNWKSKKGKKRWRWLDQAAKGLVSQRRSYFMGG